MKTQLSAAKKIILIGRGRLATHLQHWQKLNQNSNPKLLKKGVHYELICWHRHMDHAEAQLVQILSQLSVDDLIWLAISDGAIIPFFEDFVLKAKCKAKTIHFSGAIFDSRIYGFHPLMSFPSELLPDEMYPKIFFAQDHVEMQLQDLLPGFGNRSFLIQPGQKSRYHALCVMAGNFPQLLWDLTEKSFAELNVPVQAQRDYIQQITENFLKLGSRSITGPIIRKDADTIQKNLEGLKSDSKLSRIYKAFAEVMGL